MKMMFNISSMGRGGAERVLSNLSNALVLDNEVCILVNTKKNIVYELDNKIKVIQLDDKIYKNPLIRNFKRMEKTKIICNQEQFDVIISFLPVPSYRILYLKKQLNCKIIVSDRNNPKEEYKSLIQKILMKWLYKRADGFVFQTVEQKEYFCKEIQNKSVVIPNPLKEEFLEKRQQKKENVIINVGRLVEQKNQEMLIRCFQKFSLKHQDYILKIYGDGHLKDKLQLLIETLNLKDKVFLCGVSNNIKEELLKSKIFVLSSNYEGMPNALLEAMACGLACISTDCPCGGPKELIKNQKNGILISVNDENALLKELENLMDNSNFLKKIGKEAENITDILNPVEINKKWYDYIKEVVNND